jgi:hypothetical protein
MRYLQILVFIWCLVVEAVALARPRVPDVEALVPELVGRHASRKKIWNTIKTFSFADSVRLLFTDDIGRFIDLLKKRKFTAADVAPVFNAAFSAYSEFSRKLMQHLLEVDPLEIPDELNRKIVEVSEVTDELTDDEVALLNKIRTAPPRDTAPRFSSQEITPPFPMPPDHPITATGADADADDEQPNQGSLSEPGNSITIDESEEKSPGYMASIPRRGFTAYKRPQKLETIKELPVEPIPVVETAKISEHQDDLLSRAEIAVEPEILEKPPSPSTPIYRRLQVPGDSETRPMAREN